MYKIKTTGSEKFGSDLNFDIYLKRVKNMDNDENMWRCIPMAKQVQLITFEAINAEASAGPK